MLFIFEEAREYNNLKVHCTCKWTRFVEEIEIEG